MNAAEWKIVRSAVIAERERCARIVEERLALVTGHAVDIFKTGADDIRRPKKPRKRPDYCCGICGADDHTAPRHPKTGAGGPS